MLKSGERSRTCPPNPFPDRLLVICKDRSSHGGQTTKRFPLGAFAAGGERSSYISVWTKRNRFPLRLLYESGEVILVADPGTELELTAKPVEVFLLVGQIGLEDVVCERIVRHGERAVAEHRDALFLDLEVGLDVFDGVFDDLAALASFEHGLAAEIEDALLHLLDPAHLLGVVGEEFVAELGEACRFERLALKTVHDGAFGEAGYKYLQCVDRFLGVYVWLLCLRFGLFSDVLMAWYVIF